MEDTPGMEDTHTTIPPYRTYTATIKEQRTALPFALLSCFLQTLVSVMAPPFHNTPTVVVDDEEKGATKKTKTTTTTNSVAATEMDSLLAKAPQQQAQLEKPYYDVSFPFRLMSGSVWFSMFLWGIWISVFYSHAFLNDKLLMNIVFPDLWIMPQYPVASWAISIHFIGAAYMSMAGAFQLVKYIRKTMPILHRWVGRFYILASLIASIGGNCFILFKGSYGGRQADYAFLTYGIIFLLSGVMTYVYARKKDYQLHKLWAWRLYSLSLAAWIYRFDYYSWMLFFGHGDKAWLHKEDYRAPIDYWINWMFYVPGLVVVEIVFRWGETATLSSTLTRILDIGYYCVFVMAVVFTIHAMVQLWIPSVMNTYDWDNGWIL